MSQRLCLFFGIWNCVTLWKIPFRASTEALPPQSCSKMQALLQSINDTRPSIPVFGVSVVTPMQCIAGVPVLCSQGVCGGRDIRYWQEVTELRGYSLQFSTCADIHGCQEGYQLTYFHIFSFPRRHSTVAGFYEGDRINCKSGNYEQGVLVLDIWKGTP